MMYPRLKTFNPFLWKTVRPRRWCLLQYPQWPHVSWNWKIQKLFKDNQNASGSNSRRRQQKYKNFIEVCDLSKSNHLTDCLARNELIRGGPAGGRGGHLPTGRLHLNSKSTFSFLYLKHFPFCHQTGFDCYLLFEIGEIGFLHWPTWLSFCPCLTYVQAEVEGSWLKRHHLNVFKQP